MTDRSLSAPMQTAAPSPHDADAAPGLLEHLHSLQSHWRALAVTAAACTGLAFGASYLIAPVYVSTTSFILPQQQGGGSAALAQLSALAGVAGASVGQRNPADLYVSMMQSVTVSDRIIDRFKLVEVYDKGFRDKTRQMLAKNVRMNVGKKDGLVTIDVEDTSPQRAADMANAYVEELRKLTSTLAVTEAQARRVYFENQVKDTRTKLDEAQKALQQSGFNRSSLQAEPRAAADTYARLQAQLTAAEVLLETLRSTRTEESPEVQQQQGTVGALRQQLAQIERNSSDAASEPGSQYLSKYRDFKYQETLLELFSRQYELARVDESRDSQMIQVLDKAAPAEHKARPQRAVMAGTWGLFGLFAAALWFAIRDSRRTRSRAA